MYKKPNVDFSVFKHEFLGASRSYFFPLLFLPYEISLYFTLITQNLSLSLSLPEIPELIKYNSL